MDFTEVTGYFKITEKHKLLKNRYLEICWLLRKNVMKSEQNISSKIQSFLGCQFIGFRPCDPFSEKKKQQIAIYILGYFKDNFVVRNPKSGYLDTFQHFIIYISSIHKGRQEFRKPRDEVQQ